MAQSPFSGFGTDAIHKGQDPYQWDADQVVVPLSLSTTYAQRTPAQVKKYDYVRAGNPTRDAFETCLASLEGAKYCHSFASGLATTGAITSMLNSGDHILCCDDVYGGTQRQFRKIWDKNGITTDMVRMTDAEHILKALTENTKMVWIETPTNPLLTVVDIKAVISAIKAVRSDVHCIVDNTFMSPYFQRPLELGADVVMHSVTKYINGHSDVLMGACMTNDDKIAEHLSFSQLAMGAPAAPFDCYLANRGLKTLHVRMRTHEQNALRVATFLEGHDLVEKVLHPALPSHPQHEIHKRQAKGMSGMVSFYLKGGLKQSEKFLQSLKIFTLAESLGGFESLAELPSVMTHASVPAEERAVLGITDNLIRLSVGLEEADDLVKDLDNALKESQK